MPGININISSSSQIDQHKIHNTATDTFINDLLFALLGDSSSPLTSIDKIVLVDTGLVERDVINISMNEWVLDSSQYTLTITKRFTASATYTLSRIRLYSGSKLYFEGLATLNIQAGRSYRYTGIIYISTAYNIIDSPPNSNTVVRDHMLKVRILGRLRGEPHNITIYRAIWGMSYPNIYVGRYVLTKDIYQQRAYHDIVNFQQSGSYRYVWIETNEPQYIIEIDTNNTYVVSTDDQCSFNITISVVQGGPI